MSINRLKSKLVQFLASKALVERIKANGIEVYMRKSRRFIEGQMLNALDVASIYVDPSRRGKGFGTEVIDAIHRINPFEVTYIENLLNHRLALRLQTNGWQDQVSQGEEIHSMCKLKPLVQQ